MHKLQCAEIWGGIKKEKADIASPNVTASLFASSGDGNKGGDIYYLTLCNSSYITRIVIADVLGHGESVSKLSQSLYGSLKNHVNEINGSGVLADLNEEATRIGIRAMTTALVATYYKHDNSFSYVYAGHSPILIKHKNENNWREAKINNEKENKLANIPLGVDRDATYLQDSITLNRGDKVLMYTDGLTETASKSRELFGKKRLLKILNENGNKPIHKLRDNIISELYKYANGKLDHDDVTLLCLEIQ